MLPRLLRVAFVLPLKPRSCFADTVNMEIINCMETSRPRKIKAFGQPQRASAKRPPFKRISPHTVALAVRREPTAYDLALSLRGQAGILSKRVRRASRFVWPVVSLCLCAACAVLVARAVSYMDSFAHKVDFAPSEIESEITLLEGEMKSLAGGKGFNFDSEGNVFSSDGKLVLPNEASDALKESVSFQQYTVKPGDTISGICVKFGLSNISTLIALNGIKNVRSIWSGQRLKVPSMDGMMHTVLSGETLAAIAANYGCKLEELLDANDLSSEALQVGQELFVPGARLDQESLRRAMGEVFTHPIKDSYRLTSRFGPRIDPISGRKSSHTGTDFACPTGTPIYASMSGKVAYTGFSSIYGNYVILNHHDGYQTLYAHMSKIIAKKGAYVTQGERIGLVGNTGYSTGPHLHFTVYKDSALVDPLTLLH